jgi:hypothetical protein
MSFIDNTLCYKKVIVHFQGGVNYRGINLKKYSFANIGKFVFSEDVIHYILFLT